MKKILILLLIITYFFSLKNFSKIYSADLYYKDSQRQLALRKEKTALVKAQIAISLNPNEPRYRLGTAKIFLSSQNENSKPETLENLKKAYDLNPKNLVTIRNSIPLYYLIAIKDIYKKPGKDNIDKKYLEIVKSFFKDTKKKYPNDVGVYVLIAGYERSLEFDEEHKNSIERIRILRPDLLQWYEGL